jgi:alpha-L-fucosidase 2
MNPPDIITGMATDGYIIRAPATTWRDALPCGNGVLGALVYGRVAQERVLLNHEALYTGGDTQRLPDTAAHLETLRRLLAQGDYAAANGYFAQCWAAAGYQAHAARYQPGPVLSIHHRTEDVFADYQRTLDFRTGEAQVRWTDHGRQCQRRLFVSRADRCVVHHEAVIGGVLDCVLAWETQGGEESNDDNGLTIPLEQQVQIEAANGRLAIEVNDGEGMVYHAYFRFETDGLAQWDATARAWRISGATSVWTAATVAPGRLPADWAAAAGCLVDPRHYAAALARHSELHGALYNRVRLWLGDTSGPQLDNERLLLDAYQGVVSPVLVGTLFNFGRYLLISAVAPGSYPPNLQGLWNGDYQPPWWCAFFFNENMQMKYWQALPGGLGELMLPLFDLLESRLADFRLNAQLMFGCRGILPPLYMTPDSGLKKNPQAHVQYWTGSGGWLAQFYFDYWQFTGDDAFLRDRAVPFMREVAAFYEDFLVEGPDGLLMFSPSNSPENHPDGHVVDGVGLRVCVNATMDFAIARELLTNLITATRHLAIEDGRIAVWQGMMARFPAYRINADGAIAEWLHDDLKDNYHHRHLSHLYPVFPGMEITEESDPQLYAACETALEKRLCIGLQEQTGWSLAHLACAYARMGRGDRALGALELITRSTLGINGFTYHNDWRGMGITMDLRKGRWPAFQIEANMGWTAAIFEMLAFSNGAVLKILPALPTAWRKGSIGWVRCRGGFEVRLEWNADEGYGCCAVRALRSLDLRVCLPRGGSDARLEATPDACGAELLPFGDLQTYRLRMPDAGTVQIGFLFEGNPAARSAPPTAFKSTFSPPVLK